MSLKIVCLYILFFLIAFRAMSQYSDAQLWTDISVEKMVTKTLSCNFSQVIRLNENFTEDGKYTTDLGLNYKINKSFRLAASYRFSRTRQEENIYNNSQRFYVDGIFRYKNNFASLYLRTRFQTQYRNGPPDKNSPIPENYWRNKLTVKINLDQKYSPYLSSELYYPLNNPVYKLVNNIRYCAGIEYEFNNLFSIDLFYLIQKELNVNNPEKDYVIGISYKFTFF